MRQAHPQPVHSVYVHVPFCAQKCGYCAFYSTPASEAEMDRYVSAWERELATVADGLEPETIFFGGGTPSLLSLSHWERIATALDRRQLLSRVAEWTVECNPATLTLEKARWLRQAGVNRASLGIQSLDDTLLHRLGRIHSAAQAVASFDLLRAAGFGNLNVDLIFGIPGQTRSNWEATLEQALALGSEHLAAYELSYEEDTAYYRQHQAGQYQTDEDLACAMYEHLLQRAGAAGLERYEISNFARRTGRETQRWPERACQHNVNYWRGAPYHGLGPSAASYTAGERRINAASTLRYCEKLEQGQSAVEFRETLSPLGRAGELAAFGLRMTAGWDFDEFTRLTGQDLRQEWAAELQALQTQGHAVQDNRGFRLSDLGLRFADGAGALFLR